MKRCIIAVLSAAGLMSGCSTLSYYSQAIGGQLDILNRAVPIETLMREPQTPAELRARLAIVVDMRDFASRELKLPENDSYRRYAALDRPYAVWNVFAAEPLSVAPRQWCFFIIGCVAYRGYFERSEAERFAAELAAEGLDVYVAGIPAFSTLGWFDDPVLSTFVHQNEVSLAGLIFHELAHQQLYLKGDSAFSESFATVVEIEGVRRWALARKQEGAYASYLASRDRREQFVALVLAARKRLEQLYAGEHSDMDKRRQKAKIIAVLKRDYQSLKKDWGGWSGYDFWFDKPINNAQIASVGLYHRHVAALRHLLHLQQNDLAAFYREAEKLAEQTPVARDARLTELAKGAVR